MNGSTATAPTRFRLSTCSSTHSRQFRRPEGHLRANLDSSDSELSLRDLFCSLRALPRTGVQDFARGDQPSLRDLMLNRRFSRRHRKP